MNKHDKNIPVLLDLLNAKKEYEHHVHKLSKIRQQRRTSLTRKSLIDKTIMIEHIKDQKHCDFIKKIIKEQNRIANQNTKIYMKLNQTMNATRRSMRNDSLSKSSLSVSLRKQKDKQIQVENERIAKKIRTSSSSISTKKISDEYERSLKIRNRLRKYDQNCLLKSEKVLKASESLNQRIKFSAQTSIPKPNQSTSLKFKTKIGSYYKKEDILKNKIQFRTLPERKKLASIRISSRQRKKSEHLNHFAKDYSTNPHPNYEFFNTQLDPQKFYHKKHQ